MIRLAIIGPGLLGGSIALAARRAGGFHVAVWARRVEAVAELEQRALAEVASTDLAAVVQEANIVVLWWSLRRCWAFRRKWNFPRNCRKTSE